MEEDNCLVTLAHTWIVLHNPKVPAQAYESLIHSINELSDKFGYSIKTYNLLGTVLMIKGETEKAMQIFKTCLDENGVLTDESCPLLAQNNQDLACLIFNYIKCNCVANMHGSMTSADYL